MTTTRHPLPLRTTLAAVFATITLAALPACDEAADDEAFRDVTLTDTWDVQDPTHFPEINSCDDYWNTRCAELSDAQCSYLRARYTCSSSMSGVTVTDHFGDALDAEAASWRVYVRGAADFSKSVATPAAACSLIASPKLAARCNEMTELATAATTLIDLAPNGGIAPILPADEIGDELPFFADDLGLELLEGLDWNVPALSIEAREHVAGFVAEDEIMLLTGPEGTVVVSSKNIVLIRDIRSTMDKVEVCVDVDVK
jgi:hypothetical protein